MHAENLEYTDHRRQQPLRLQTHQLQHRQSQHHFHHQRKHQHYRTFHETNHDDPRAVPSHYRTGKAQNHHRRSTTTNDETLHDLASTTPTYA